MDLDSTLEITENTESSDLREDERGERNNKELAGYGMPPNSVYFFDISLQGAQPFFLFDSREKMEFFYRATFSEKLNLDTNVFLADSSSGAEFCLSENTDTTCRRLTRRVLRVFIFISWAHEGSSTRTAIS